MPLIQAAGMQIESDAMPTLSQLKLSPNRTKANTKASKVMVVTMMTNMSMRRCTKSILSFTSTIKFMRKSMGERKRM